MNASREEPAADRLDDASLAALLGLAELDRTIAEMRAERERRPRELRAQKRELEGQQAEVQKAKDLVLEAQKKIDALSVDSDSIMADVKRLEGQLFNLKSNDEFNAMKSQIKTRNEQNEKLQDRVLELMMAMDPLREGLAKEEEELKEVEGRFKAAEARVEKIMSDAAAKIEETVAAREQASANLIPEHRELYESVLDRRGTAMAKILDEVCRGCDTRVTVQTLNATMAHHLVQCPHCDRILYIDR